jgi:DNA-binding CsgD family transcriptional regulator
MSRRNGDAMPAEDVEPASAAECLDDLSGATGCLDDLSGPARHLVEIGAVLGKSFAVADVAAVQGRMAGGLVEAVQEAVDAGVLIATPTAFRFGHAGIRHAAQEAVPAPLLLALHRQIGELRIEQGDWEAAAYHLMQGVDSGDRVAAAGLERVAHEIRTSAPEWASEFALRSLALTDSDDDARFARAATAVTNLVTAGRVGEADYLAHCALAAHGMPPWAAARLRLALAELDLFSSRYEAAVEKVHRVVSCPEVPAPLRTSAELWLVWARLAVDDRAGAATQVAAILSGGAGRDQTLPPALAALGLLTWRGGLAADAIALLRSAVQRGDRQPDAAGGPFGRLCLAWMLTAIGDLEEATQVIDAARDEISARSETLWSPGPEFAAARVHLAAGRLDDAVVHARGAIDVAAAVGASSFVSRARAVLAEVALMRGELSEAAAHLESGRHGGQSMAWPPWRMSTQRMVGARLTEAEDGPEKVLAGAVDLYDDVAVDARILLDDPAGAPWLVRTALAAGDRERAGRVAAQAERLAALNGSIPAVVAASHHARGLCEADPELLQKAGAMHRTIGAQLAAWEDAGASLLDAGDKSAAKAQFERAVVAYEQLGAERDAARVRSRLRAIGVRWQHGRRAERPVSGLESLTDTEQAVAGHVAEGLTNAQVAERMFLSRHTVDFNLRQVFRKLGIRSRVALARVYLEGHPGTDAKNHASM